MHLSIDESTTILIDVIVIQLLNVDSNQLRLISLCLYVYVCVYVYVYVNTPFRKKKNCKC